MDWFDYNSVEMDEECLSQDFDDIDLYCQKMIEDDQEELDIDFDY